MASGEWWESPTLLNEQEGGITPEGIAARMVRFDVELERLYDELQLCSADFDCEAACRGADDGGRHFLRNAVWSLGAAGDSLEAAVVELCASLGLETPNCIGRE